MAPSLFRRAATVAALALSSLILAVAQATAATITGTVTQVGGAPLSGMEVHLWTSAGLHASTVTDGSGFYVFSGLQGTYYVKTFSGIFVSYMDELFMPFFAGLPCVPCDVTTGFAFVVSGATVVNGVNFQLEIGGGFSGTVRDAGTMATLNGVVIDVYDGFGMWAKSFGTFSAGAYTISGLIPGRNYFARTRSTLNYADRLYNQLPCSPCSPQLGTPIMIQAGVTQPNINFNLSPGGIVTGTVTDAATAGALASVTVQIFPSTGSIPAKAGVTNASGVFSLNGLPTGTYYARTAVPGTLNYLDELYNNLPCVPTCTATSGAPIGVVAGATQSGVNFSLAPNLIQNGRFDSGTTSWLQFGAPDMSYLESNVTNGIFQFRRLLQVPGNPVSQGVVFQETGIALPTGTPLWATFQIGNTSSVRKYMKVLLVGDPGFSDLAACTFWLGPNAPLTTYQMKAFTTKAWTNASLYFYASSPRTDDAYYQVDNVTLQQAPGQAIDRVQCIDPLVPVPPGGAAGPDLLTNGNFDTGVMAPWTLFGTITPRDPIVGGVFEFIRPANTHPAGVVLQATSQAMAQGQILTAMFQLGNSSGVRKRALVLVHDNDFSDLAACTFWMAPGQPLSNYSMTLYASKAWTNATVSVYPSTIGVDEWIRLDNVTLRRTPSTATVGSECVELGVGPPPEAAARSTSPDGGPVLRPGGSPYGDWTELDLTHARGATLRLDSWLLGRSTRGAIQVSTNGVDWITIQTIGESDRWTSVEVDLRDFVGEMVWLRFVFDLTAFADAESPALWRIGGIEIRIMKH